MKQFSLRTYAALLISIFLFAACASSKLTASPSRDGTSFEKAIVVSSIKEEYEWVRANHPGLTLKGQKLVFKGKKPFDILNFQTSDGTARSFYFDTGKFYGKF